MLRCFEGEVTHVEGSVDPLRDAETVETELMLADLESVEKQIETATKRARGQDKEAIARLEVLNAVAEVLREGQPARKVQLRNEQKPILKLLQLLTTKPVLYCANVEEENAGDGNAYSEEVRAKAEAEGAGFVVVSAAIEAEVAALETPEEKQEFLAELGLTETGLNRVIREGYRLLDLITFFTVGPKEARAWTVKRGATAPQAAGVIHTDFEKGFIRAETIAYDDFVTLGGEQACKDAGKMRQEGKDYIVKDGDIFHFRFNV